MAAHQFEVAGPGIIQVGVVGDEITVPMFQRRTQHADLVEELDRRHLVLADNIVEFQHAIGRVGRHRHFQIVGKDQRLSRRSMVDVSTRAAPGCRGCDHRARLHISG